MKEYLKFKLFQEEEFDALPWKMTPWDFVSPSEYEHLVGNERDAQPGTRILGIVRSARRRKRVKGD